MEEMHKAWYGGLGASMPALSHYPSTSTCSPTWKFILPVLVFYINGIIWNVFFCV